MSKRDPRTEWPREWLAFELLRRLPDYRKAWVEYRASCDSEPADPHGWGAIMAKAAAHRFPAPPPARGAFRPSAAERRSGLWAVPFGLHYMLDPDLDAAAHDHVPWRPTAGPIPVGFVRGGESFVFDPASNPYFRPGIRRFVAVRLDLCRPLDAQLAEAKELITALLWEPQKDPVGASRNKPVRASRGRSAHAIVRALDALDLDAAGKTSAEVARALSAGKCTSDDGSKLVRRARFLATQYLAVANGLAVQDT